MKDKLLDELTIRYVEVMPKLPVDVAKDELLYDLCGYLLHTHKSVMECEACKNGMITNLEDLPESFLAPEYTATRTRGGLKFATESFFNVFNLVEQVVSKQFKDKSHVFIKDSCDRLIDQICDLNLKNPCCESHPETLPYLITEYVRIRYHFESTRYRNLYFSKEQSQRHADSKKSKI